VIERGICSLVVHCAATPNGRPHTASDIDRWHGERGFARLPEAADAHRPDLRHIGYHYVIRLDGVVEEGRSIDEIGAHVAGYNHHSIGLCLIGTDRFTLAQWDSLRQSVLGLRQRFAGIGIIGHRQINPHKTCPGFDVRTWLMTAMTPLAKHVLPPGGNT